LIVTFIQTVWETLLSTTTAMQTLRITDTVTTTRTTTAMTIIYPPRAVSSWVTDRRNGDKDTRPFT